MDVSVESTSNLGRRLKISVPGEIVNEQIKGKMAKLSREAHIKGFRPGKIPLQVLQKKFGPSIRMEVINELIRQSLNDAVKENDLAPAGTPQIEEIKDESDHSLQFTATFDVYPQITLAPFEGVEIERRRVEISNDDIQKMKTKLQDQFADWLNVDRPVAKDDKLTVDFARIIQVEGAKKEEQKSVQLIVGHDGVLPGLSEALIGKQKGDEVEVALTYPEDWTDTAAAGKAVTLWVTVHEIAEKKNLSEEELAKKLGIEGDLEKLTHDIKERMDAEVQSVLQDEVKEKVLEALLDKNPIEIPLSLVEQEKEAIRREVARSRRTQMSQQALDPEEIQTSARKRVELGLLLNEVIKKYQLKAAGQKVRAEIEKIAMRYAKPAEVVEAYYKNNELLFNVERMVLLDQAVDAILREVNIKDVNATFDEVMNPVEEPEAL